MSTRTLESIKVQIDEIVEKDIVPHLEFWEQERIVPFHLINNLGSKGIIENICREPDGFDNKLYLAKKIGKLSLGISSTILNTLNIPLYLLRNYANEELKQKYLSPYLQGKLIGAVAITEPHGGSNFINNCETRIKIYENHVELSGKKHFILNIPGADFVIVLAKSGNGNILSHTLVLVPLDLIDSNGIFIERIQTSGLHTAALGIIHFNNVLLPKEYVIGRLHKGLIYLENALTEERLVGTYALMSMTEEVIRETYSYVNNRPMFESKLADLQSVRHKLAELSAEYEIANLFLEDVIKQWRAQKSRDSSTKAAMAKLVCTQAALKVINGCLQLYGGRGFLHEYKISRIYRDALGSTSFAGTLEMMKEIISNRKI
ncbi:alkylation response protein AidB-like acyl-CoA dehydrogenase [Thermolongibacillus altinsuensis]|uniref:Acyl-[acyl-carrier-protein] dehydrogenase MbtN n=1 Tax=Thermolongibacillus altinsuensis TaxID=575256 RepID=A0A4R1Q600_9BACL|nr:acyl-CoA dehydrogenase [Thermolongibacillus altinsuensis]TCL43365.1 alkylation response protein AidB-like acyl-CoA dehydrogenase [Thermolongibacillus altinsuensis]